MKALIISDDDFEDTELLYPYYRLKEEGYEVKITSPRKKKITGKHGYSIKVDMATSEVNPEEFDLLILPGGKAPEKVRLDKNAVNIAKHFDENKKTIAAICHGAQTLISAKLLKGRKATCYIAIRDDLKAAGANYIDKEVVIDENLITSRHPGDLPAFMKTILSNIKN